MTYTHKELCVISAAWLKKTLRCTISINEPKGIKENPDAIGWKFTYGNSVKEGSILIECKTSRADFKNDAKKPSRINPETGLGNWRYYLCPEGIIKEEDLPEKWGLLYINEKGKIKIIKDPYNKDIKKSKFNQINSEGERFILTRWLSKTEDPEKIVYMLRETNNKFNNLCTRYDKLKEENKKLKYYQNLFKNYYDFNKDITIEELDSEINRLRHLEYTMNLYLENPSDNLLQSIKRNIKYK